MTRYLFLCHEGQKRGPTAAIVARKLAAMKGMHIEAAEGGIAWLQSSAIPGLRGRFDRLVVMEQYMVDRLVSMGFDSGTITCLDIPDSYEHGSAELVSILERKLAPLI